MFAQIHLSSADISAEPEHTKIPTTTRRPRRLPNMATLHPHLWAWEPPPYSMDLLWLPQLQASAHALPSASSALPLYLDRLWSCFMARLRGSILRSLP